MIPEEVDVNYEIWIYSGHKGRLGSINGIYGTDATFLSQARIAYDYWYINNVQLAGAVPNYSTWYKYVHEYKQGDVNVHTWIYGADGTTLLHDAEYAVAGSVTEADEFLLAM